MSKCFHCIWNSGDYTIAPRVCPRVNCFYKDRDVNVYDTFDKFRDTFNVVLSNHSVSDFDTIFSGIKSFIAILKKNGVKKIRLLINSHSKHARKEHLHCMLTMDSKEDIHKYNQMLNWHSAYNSVMDDIKVGNDKRSFILEEPYDTDKVIDLSPLQATNIYKGNSVIKIIASILGERISDLKTTKSFYLFLKVDLETNDVTGKISHL